VVEVMGNAYPELHASHELVRTVVEREEQAFRATLQRGVEMLDGLAAKGDIVRVPHPTDRRAQVLEPTVQAAEKIDSSYARFHEAVVGVMDHLSSEDNEVLARCLSPAVRAHVTGGGGAPEHRPVTVAFIKLEGIDALIATRGPQAAADVLQRVVTVVESATEAQRVALLASDIDVDGGKLILTAGAPIATGEDEERMLLALRGIVDAGLPVDLRIGVNRGAIFAGDIGPFYRRTYTVMGDVVNLAARLMAKAPPGRIYATADVLDRSNTLFEVTALEPFAVKGKAKSVAAWDVGKATG
jgi:class 3 adenylate cyclase